MEKIVYLLGAGFSAPLGLPVMSNFRIMSQDMYLEKSDAYTHFKEVFDTIRDMSISKNYYDANLFNIEDILSILEMREYLEGKNLKDSFIKYIMDVIEYYTPEIPHYETGKVPGNWYEWLFGTDTTWKHYGMFIGALMNLRFRVPSGRHFNGNYSDILCEQPVNPNALYSIITLNYDIIPEMICNFIASNFNTSGKLSITNGINQLAKLHGSIDTGVIIPPTWSKGVNKEIVPAWKLAFKLLAEATQLRIIGYSLASADAYVKYLLKSAVIQDPHLKNIDVICLDTDDSVRQRYDAFIKFDYYKFVNSSVSKYLKYHAIQYRNTGSSPEGLVLNKLEWAHSMFMSTDGTPRLDL